MHLVIAKVDEVFFDAEAKSVHVPASDGDMTILPKHMPLITTLRKGTITVKNMQQESKQFPVEGGVLEIGREGVTVLL